jgi:hypothetical protein
MSWGQCDPYRNPLGAMRLSSAGGHWKLVKAVGLEHGWLRMRRIGAYKLV